MHSLGIGNTQLLQMWSIINLPHSSRRRMSFVIQSVAVLEMTGIQEYVALK